ncbi:YHS domain-containing (seleno)protein [Mesorhizobium sp. RMAD-H1]|uniref:YHS domain-containing (seleno)protein n=1 Tax=Mesorhizobium sp. RMAD-H1 TaxID=2587065 RepID=UPI0017A9BE00|nr:YHS domain-containing (seleno)protein [Mesorhizobium sp. RMAD-H1]MBB2972949.1 YHS domain-containing protein [Mesorhizobium sp. RMAD-H1]
MRHRRKKDRFIVAAIGSAALLLSLVQAGTAEEPAAVNTGYFGDIAIKGYDPVAYFTQNRAVEGSPQYSYRWLGATWQFVSAENRDLFAREPVKYAPQYGGYCADGVSFGTITTNIDPKAWRIIEGKLYLSYDPGAAEGFEKKPTKLVDSQKYWPEVQQTLMSEKAGEGR